MNRYGEFSKKLCYSTTCGGDFVFIFVAFQESEEQRKLFICKKQCKTTQKSSQNLHLARKNINFKESQVSLTFM